MNYEELASGLVKKALKAGASEAEVYLQTGKTLSLTVRKGDIESLSQSTPKQLGLRVITKKKLAFSSTSDFSKDSLDRFVKDTVQLAMLSSEDPFNGLPEIQGPLPRPSLKIRDETLGKVSLEKKIELARRAEAAALGYSKQISRNGEGGSYSEGHGLTVLSNSHGITGSYADTYCALSVSPLAEANGKKEIGGESSVSRFFSKLKSPEAIGTLAAEKTVRKLGARKVPSQNVPVLFDPEVAANFWSHVFEALDGDAVFRKLSFLEGKRGKKIASPHVTLVDEGLMIGGLDSSPFDGEGVPVSNRTIIEAGTLLGYFYTAYSAKQAKEKPTGNAQRSARSQPELGPNNLYLKPGKRSQAELIASIDRGLLLTDVMGFGVNTVSGDYSVGAAGLWIEKGKIVFPVSEITVASSLTGILQGIEEVGSDLEWKGSISSPSFLVREMTVSGT